MKIYYYYTQKNLILSNSFSFKFQNDLLICHPLICENLAQISIMSQMMSNIHTATSQANAYHLKWTFARSFLTTTQFSPMVLAMSVQRRQTMSQNHLSKFSLSKFVPKEEKYPQLVRSQLQYFIDRYCIHLHYNVNSVVEFEIAEVYCFRILPRLI